MTTTIVSERLPAVRRRRGIGWWLPFASLGLVLFVGVFAPLLANDVPLLARVDGKWSMPAVADLFGEPPAGPHDGTWKQWWSRLGAGSEDFGIMPPWPYGPTGIDASRFGQRPCLAHPLGNDDTGRDVLARLVHGAGTVVWLGLPAVLLAAAVGAALGAWAGLAGGIVDLLVLRLIELSLCFPMLLFLLFAAAFFGTSPFGMVAVLALMFWTSFARIVRGEMLSLRERDYVLVARGLGLGPWRIFLRHLLPQVRTHVLMTAAFCMAAAIVAESTLSYLGVGGAGGGAVASWGAMLRQGSERAVVGSWHLWLFPALAVVVVVVSCHLVADRLRPRAEQ